MKGFGRAVGGIPRGIRRAWKAVRSAAALPAPTRRFQQFFFTVVVISALAAGAGWIVQLRGLDRSGESTSASDIAAHAQDRLKAIAGSLDSSRDWLADDAAIRSSLTSNARLFSLLNDRSIEFASRLPDSTLFLPSADGDRIASRAYAIYSGEGKLLAWNSPLAATFGIDTVLSGSMLVPNRDQAILLENGPIYAYVLAIRKLVTEDGRTEAYIMAKQELATKEPLANTPAMNFLDDLPGHSLRGVVLTFGGHPGMAHSDSRWIRQDLRADPSDPTSFLGVLSISRVQQAESSLGYRIFRDIWSFGFTIALFAALLWLLITIAEATPEPKTAGSRILYSALALSALFIGRALIAELGAAEKIAGPEFQNASDFASNWSFGIAANPLELFITSVFATAAAVLIWIVWMPRERLVRDESHDRVLPQKVTHNAFVLLGMAIVSVVLWQLLLTGLSMTVESIVRDGTLRYLNIQQVLPQPGTLMMLLSFLGIGVAYLFLSVLLLTFGLRASILLTSSRFSLRRRIFLGSLLSFLLLFGSTVLFDNVWLPDTGLFIRASLAGLTFLVSVSVIVIDSMVQGPEEDGPSFLYKLPRSSRSILFILAVSAAIMSPLIADKQLIGDEKTAHRIVLENAEVDTPELQHAAELLLDNAQANLKEWEANGHDTAALHEKAFLIWFESMRSHPQWNASIDLYDAGGALESHFATLGTLNEINRMRGMLDTELLQLRTLNSHSSDMDSAVSSIRILPEFTSSGAPAIVGGIRVADTSRSVSTSTVSSRPNAKGPLFLTISLWSELPALANSRSRISILPGTNPASLNPVANDGFIVAQYRPICAGSRIAHRLMCLLPFHRLSNNALKHREVSGAPRSCEATGIKHYTIVQNHLREKFQQSFR